VTQLALLCALVVLGLQQAPPAGTVAAFLGAVLPPVALGALALIGLPGLFAPGPRTARVVYWTLEGTTVVMALFLGMALAGGLMFGGIVSPEL
jgi:hypothetical protein